MSTYYDTFAGVHVLVWVEFLISQTALVDPACCSLYRAAAWSGTTWHHSTNSIQNVIIK